MFKAAVLGQTVSDREYKKRETRLWQQLLIQQQRLRKDGFSPVIVDFSGVRGAGKSACANILSKWMDPRWINTHGYGEVTESERLRPHFWRYWIRTPARGRMGIFIDGRYAQPLQGYVKGELSHEQFTRLLTQINAFERTLADDGALIQKFWMHIDRPALEQRLEGLLSDPMNRWRVTDFERQTLAQFDRFVEAGEQIITLTNTGHAPWEIVEGTDANFRALRVGETLLESLEHHITRISLQQKYEKELEAQLTQLPLPEDDNNETVFDSLDMNQELGKDAYRELLEDYASRLPRLFYQAQQQGLTTILVFEGQDAAGKGGAIRRIVRPMDARDYTIHRISAPTEEEHAHHYLWRFWRELPRGGSLAIFDRSWYGRVLVERVEGFANSQEWRRAYGEINEFEDQLAAHGILLLKFWIHVSEEEQFKRFKAREKQAHKQWKLTPEDWRNREKWDDYEQAAHDMVRLTSDRSCPWFIIEGNNKPFARIKIQQLIHDALAKALEGNTG